VEQNTGLHSNGRLLSLPANIRIGWQWKEVANPLAFYTTATIRAVKCFIVQVHLRLLYYKTFTAIIYGFS